MIDAFSNPVEPGDEVSVPCKVEELQDGGIAVLRTTYTVEPYPEGTRVVLHGSQLEKTIRETKPEASYECQAQKQIAGSDPVDCNWPFCPCDPHADRVLTGLQESEYILLRPFAGFPANVTEFPVVLKMIFDSLREYGDIHVDPDDPFVKAVNKAQNQISALFLYACGQGDDKTLEDCKNKFRNAGVFFGVPFVPIPDTQSGTVAMAGNLSAELIPGGSPSGVTAPIDKTDEFESRQDAAAQQSKAPDTSKATGKKHKPVSSK